LKPPGLLPSSPFTAALVYIRNRRSGLEVFLVDPDVPIDTNHLERALRAIPVWTGGMFCWTELGAKHIGIVQSLIITCCLHGIDPYDDLVDVLACRPTPLRRRPPTHPQAVEAPFAANPLRSNLYSIVK
jgi:hypothetical protein